MKIYNAFVKKDSSNKIEDILIFDEAFSFYALCFGAFWFIYHRMFRVALIVFLFEAFPVFFGGDLNSVQNIFFSLLQIFISIIIAANANYLFAKYYREKFDQSFTILAANKESAYIKALELLYEENSKPDFAAIFNAKFLGIDKNKAKIPYFTA